MDGRDEVGRQELDEDVVRTLRAMGVTILGIVTSIGTTVGMGLTSLPWWGRLGCGVLIATLLAIIIKLGTSQGSRGPVARLADWMTGTSDGR